MIEKGLSTPNFNTSTRSACRLQQDKKYAPSPTQESTRGPRTAGDSAYSLDICKYKICTNIRFQVTTDPRSKQEIPEAVGIVTSDSLAAESLKGSGSFGENNPHAQASKQPSHSTTTNTTDVSGATRLAPAVDAEAREAQEGWSENSQLNAGAGLQKDSGAEPTYNLSATGGVPGTGETGGTGVPIAPGGGYAGSDEVSRASGDFKPKGKNITEGGFDESAPNASFNNEIGSKNDPARAAELKIQQENAQSGADAAGGPRQGDVDA